MRTTGIAKLAATANRFACPSAPRSWAAAVPANWRSMSGLGVSSTRGAIQRAYTGPARTAVGAAMARPRTIVRPRSACNPAIAMSGPGWGGAMACKADKDATAGIASNTQDRPVRPVRSSASRATAYVIGSSMISPTSKNIGIPTTNAAAPMSQGRARSEARPTIADAIRAAAPESESILPRTAPSATVIPTSPRIWPAPLDRVWGIFSGASRAATAVITLITSRATNGCHWSRLLMSVIKAAIDAARTPSKYQECASIRRAYPPRAARARAAVFAPKP